MSIGIALPAADTWGMHGDIGTGWWIVMAVMVVFWGAVLLGGAGLLRATLDGRRHSERETPGDILDRRFAEGAISADDYYERREVLENGSRATTVAREDEPPVAAGAGGGSTP